MLHLKNYGLDVALANMSPADIYVFLIQLQLGKRLHRYILLEFVLISSETITNVSLLPPYEEILSNDVELYLNRFIYLLYSVFIIYI